MSHLKVVDIEKNFYIIVLI